MEAMQQEESVTTKPVNISGKLLFVNARADHGELRAEIQDESGKAVRGFSAKEYTSMKTDAVRVAVSWKGKSTPKQAQVRLRSELKNAGIYSFWWE
jgi:hypothetical protein